MIMTKPSMTLVLTITVLATALLGTAAPAGAQDYPSRPITLIVPYAAGGGTTSWRESRPRR
jgi:tripartite-type tricarboxylate transporter receptor subunit TctC